MRFIHLAGAGLGLALGAGALYAFWAPITTMAALVTATLTTYANVITLLLLLIIAATVAAGARALLALADALHWRAQRIALLPPDRGIVHVEDARDPRVLAMSIRAIDRTLDIEETRAHAAIVAGAHQQPHTYAPHLVIRHDARAADQSVASAGSAHGSITPPALHALIASGEVGRGRPLLLGVDATTGEMVRGGFRDLYSTGIGGLTGTGKTWAAALLLGQSAAHGARLVIADLHAGDSESLAVRCTGLRSALLCDVAADPAAILAALRLVSDELNRRKAGAPDRWALVVAIDEWTALLRGGAGEEAARLVEAITTEGRKLNIHALLMAQRWDKTAVGEFRNTLASGYVFRCRLQEARMLTGLPASVLPPDVLTLPPGHAYLVTTAGDIRRIVMPRTTADDIAALGAQATPAPGETSRAATAPVITLSPGASETPAGRQRDAYTSVASKTSGRGGGLSPEEARIAALFVSGKSIPEIVMEVYHISSTGGRAYQSRRTEVEAAIRKALGGGS
ncbi:MAG: hypothetical protein RMJ55_12495 [Roseiflexaceae bacterium]|nr:hypothetical protein [Roseiflexaceae bacterium]MDW8392418.1 hypothetical protein [Oscillochloridaceae bacterium]